MKEVLFILFFFAMTAGASPAYPLKASSNGKFLVDQNNTPVFVVGDSAWYASTVLSSNSFDFYLKDCQTNGINSINVSFTDAGPTAGASLYYSPHSPTNFYGNAPFTVSGSFTKTNEPYFKFIDYVISKAAEYGIQVIASPLYLGCCNDGYASAFQTNSLAEVTTYGAWIGNRYKASTNIIWTFGNDLGPTSPNDIRTKMQSMARAVTTNDNVIPKLATYHNAQPSEAITGWSETTDDWITLNNVYTYSPVQTTSLAAYDRTSNRRPFIFFEGIYENIQAPDDGFERNSRRQMYVPALCGASGAIYGNFPIWHFNGWASAPSPNDNWTNHLADAGRVSLRYFKALFESRQWWILAPDETGTVLTAGLSSGTNYNACARTTNGTTVMAYINGNNQVIIDMTKVSGSTAKAYWFSPKYGTNVLINTYATSGTQNFTPTSNTDWVLVIDDASASNLDVPGGAAFSAGSVLLPAVRINPKIRGAAVIGF